MPSQQFGAFMFESPPEWSRRAFIVFAHPSGEATSTLVVTRDVRTKGEDIATCAWRRLFEIAQTGPSREVLDARPVQIGGQTAFRALVTWPGSGCVVQQAIAWIDGVDGTMLVVTCTSPDGETLEPFEQLLMSLQKSAPVETPVPRRPPSVAPPPPSGYSSIPMPGARPVRG